ncbi:MAG: NADH:flavin oxidoreductase [Deltaproteobacteria bacterium]|nr:NADH:flavin oxidoreductase [Deltaproteobacteria bacterium]
MSIQSLFSPFQLKKLHLANRFVMAPMTRSQSPEGVPSAEVADYYARRAAGGVGLIIAEGTVVDRPASSNDARVPHFYGDAALAGWQQVVAAVHQAGGVIAPQLWHMGVVAPHKSGWLPTAPFEGPSGLNKDGILTGHVMSVDDIEAVIAAFAEAASRAKRLGFDCLELHGAHGYLIDQFFWATTNRRQDRFGGVSLRERTRFAADIVRAVRRAVGDDLVIILRLSQWKQGAYDFKLAATPDEMAAWLQPLADAGVDIFHCSQRRFWEAEFAGSDLNFAGWAKKLTGKATITVGSVGLSGDFIRGFQGESSTPQSVDALVERFDRGEFDLVGIGRALLSDPQWISKLKRGDHGAMRGFKPEDLATLS